MNFRIETEFLHVHIIRALGKNLNVYTKIDKAGEAKLRYDHANAKAAELLSGLITFGATLLWGDIGLLGLTLFFIGMFITHKIPDEREMTLLFKATALEGSAMGFVMGIIYFFFEGYNWFHGFASFALITRGIIGWIVFRRG